MPGEDDGIQGDVPPPHDEEEGDDDRAGDDDGGLGRGLAEAPPD